nr:MAG: UDP-2,3-diacylglucosamine hydrolase [Caudoviricetes sp.]
MRNKYRAIFISDTHLGSKDCKADLLLNFLEHNSCNTLYLVGDIIDGWKIQQNKWKWKKSHTDVIRFILKLSKKTRIIYVVGNHDEFLRPVLPHGISFGKIEFLNKTEHIGINGKRYLVIHGDMFDGIGKIAPWLGFVGDRLYDILLDLNSKYNWIRHKFGFGYWSFSKVLKHKVKGAVDFIFDYEKNLVEYCKRKFYDGVVCGHTHSNEIKFIEGIVYINDGDFVESVSAIAEDFDGNFILLEYVEQNWIATKILLNNVNEILVGELCNSYIPKETIE